MDIQKRYPNYWSQIIKIEMKKIYLITVLSFISLFNFAQKVDYNIQDGYIAEGYDVVEYFNKNAVKGKQTYILTYNNAKYRFLNEENLRKFKTNPMKYVPQYGGWCAYAMGAKGEKVSINPKTFEIREGKLYLFYNSFFNNTLESWIEEGPEKLRKKADVNWNHTKSIKK